MKFHVNLMLILPAVCICKPSSPNETLAAKKNDTILGAKGIDAFLNEIMSQPEVKELLKKKIIQEIKKNQQNGTTEGEEGILSPTKKEPTTTIEVQPTIINTTSKVKAPAPTTTSKTKQSTTTQTSPNSKTTKTSNTQQGPKDIDAFLNKIMSRPEVKELLKKKIIQEIKKNQQKGATEGEEGISPPTTKLATQGQQKEATITMSEPENRSAVPTKRQTTAEIDAIINKIRRQPGGLRLLKNKVDEAIKQNGTTAGEEGTSSSTTKLATEGQNKEATTTINEPENRPTVPTKRQTTAATSATSTIEVPPTIITTTAKVEQPVPSTKSISKESTTIEVLPTIITTTTKVEQPAPSTKSPTKESTTTQTSPNSKTTTTSNTQQDNSNKLSTREPSFNSTTKGKSTAINDSTQATTEAESTKIPLVHYSSHDSNFPVIFMLILAIIVVIYFGYHNRNKIHQFIKTGYSRTKHSGSSYLKVKLEDDIDLPRDANREYIY